MGEIGVGSLRDERIRPLRWLSTADTVLSVAGASTCRLPVMMPVTVSSRRGNSHGRDRSWVAMTGLGRTFRHLTLESRVQGEIAARGSSRIGPRADFPPMQKSSGFSVANFGVSGWRISAGFRAFVVDRYSA